MTDQTQEKKVSPEDRQRKADERQKKKESLAKERDSRCIIVRTADVHTFMDILQFLDKGINAIKKGILSRYKAEDVVGFLQKKEAIVQDLHKLTEEINNFAKIPYKAPRALRQKPTPKK